MDKKQEFTPKYWVGHHIDQDDVYLSTARKSRHESCRKMEEIFGEDWFLDEALKVDLIEINLYET